MREDNHYAEQEKSIFRMRGMLEDQNNERRRKLAHSVMSENQRLAQDRIDRNQKWVLSERAKDQFELGATVNHALARERVRQQSYLSAIGQSLFWHPTASYSPPPIKAIKRVINNMPKVFFVLG
jgi:hypothetical protein